MGHEQNFWDRIQSSEMPNLLDSEKIHEHNHPGGASQDGRDVCSNLTKLLKEILETPPAEFDEDDVRIRLNKQIERWVGLPPKEAIGMAEAFIEAKGLPDQAKSMLIGNLLYQLYKKFYPGNPFNNDSKTKE